MLTQVKPEFNSTLKMAIFLWVGYTSYFSVLLLRSGLLTPQELPQFGRKSIVGHLNAITIRAQVELVDLGSYRGAGPPDGQASQP